jgi:antitoxin component YwqK of YwqJK toxin-antitoxin module
MAEVKRMYYPTGELKSEVFIINGKKNGERKSYHENGQLKTICNYVNDKKLNDFL